MQFNDLKKKKKNIYEKPETKTKLQTKVLERYYKVLNFEIEIIFSRIFF